MSRFFHSPFNIIASLPVNWFANMVFIGIVGIGLVVRLLNFTNPPLDFHAWRQLRSATIARAMYYELDTGADPILRQKALNISETQDKLEPPIFEKIVAITYYVIGNEYLWVARLYAIFFWLAGSIGLYLLVSQMVSTNAALVSCAYFVFLPYGIYASRSFQPDPFMVMWIIWAIWGLYNWSTTHTWKWAIFAGVLSGLAVLTKVFAVFPIIVVAVMLVLHVSKPWQKLFGDFQVWLIFGLMASIPASYYLFTVGDLALGYISGWVLGFANLWTQAWFYIRWLEKAHALMDLTWFFLGLVGIFLVDGKERKVLIGVWLGYLLIGLSVPSLIISHDYYNLFLIPTIALSIAPISGLIIKGIRKRSLLEHVFSLVILLTAVFFPLWTARNVLLLQDYREEVKGWKKIGQELPAGNLVGLTHDYNNRLRYYGWTPIIGWPHATDLDMNVLAGGNNVPESDVWQQIFAERTQGMDYFVLTIFGELVLHQKSFDSLQFAKSQEGVGDGEEIHSRSE